MYLTNTITIFTTLTVMAFVAGCETDPRVEDSMFRAGNDSGYEEPTGDGDNSDDSDLEHGNEGSGSGNDSLDPEDQDGDTGIIWDDEYDCYWQCGTKLIKHATAVCATTELGAGKLCGAQGVPAGFKSHMCFQPKPPAKLNGNWC